MNSKQVFILKENKVLKTNTYSKQVPILHSNHPDAFDRLLLCLIYFQNTSCQYRLQQQQKRCPMALLTSPLKN